MKKAGPDSDLSTGRRRKTPAFGRFSARGGVQKMDAEIAQELAVRAFIFLAVDSDRARRFAAESGLSPENLRAAAETPEFLQGVMDYFMRDESLLLSFCANCSVDPADMARAREALCPTQED